MYCARFNLFVFVMCLSVNIYAQKNDYIWLSGYESNVPDTFQGYRLGNTKMDFNQSPVSIIFDSIQMNFDITNTSYSDSDGNLLFYSNGIYAANALDETIPNTDSMDTGWVISVFNPQLAIEGERNIQGIMALPDVGNANHYYLLHPYQDSVPGTNGTAIYCSKILVTYLDMSANSGHGQALYNQPVLTGALSNPLTAVKHGNGRDWWILIQAQNTNCYYKILLDSSGLHVVDSTCLGVSMIEGSASTCCFSPDGSKFIYLNTSAGLNIYDFDRCTGELGNAVNLPMPIILDSALIINGVAVSPNSRFLYVSLPSHVYQFDLWSDNIFENIDTVANYEGWHFSIIDEDFNWPQLAPDGKIYITCGNGTPYFNVINNPDLKGDSCGFVPHGIPLPTLCGGGPNFPNYRLGSLTQSQCDTLAMATQDIRDAKEQILKVFPNPANDAATVDYGFTDWNKGAVSMEVANTLGQTVYTQALPMYSGFQKIDVSQFAVGTYTVFIKRNNATVAANKLVVVH